ncbi:ligand-binding protein SH3 [Candidatus Bathyarchaeota archaeon]|nr:MAG: ligand-binding protein SH3 [Candidatus Bathyarchaeota archaeon]
MGIIEVLIISAMPVSEIRGGIPLALYFGLNPIEAYIISFLGNIAPIPLLLIFLDKFIKIACKISVVDKFYGKIVQHVSKRKRIVEKYGYIGLTMFVAVPLPVTGAWTGALIAFLLQLNKLKSFIYITLGVLVSGLIVLLTSLGFLKILS